MTPHFLVDSEKVHYLSRDLVAPARAWPAWLNLSVQRNVSITFGASFAPISKIQKRMYNI
jgi:hypothetical protein